MSSSRHVVRVASPWARVTLFGRTIAGLVAVLPCLPAHGDSGEPLSTLDAIELYNSNSEIRWALPAPDDQQLARLRSGDVVSFLDRLELPNDDSVDRVVAYAIIESNRMRVWVATLGSETTHDSSLTETYIAELDNGGARWYQYFALPWPVADRHWAIDTAKRTELASATDNVVWEHRWQLSPAGLSSSRSWVEAGRVPGISLKNLRKAVYLPANAGGWVMIQLDDSKTLVAVHATAELGGRIPDAWVARFARRKLTKVLSNLSQRALAAEASLASSGTLFAGDGREIDQAMLGSAPGGH